LWAIRSGGGGVVAIVNVTGAGLAESGRRPRNQHQSSQRLAGVDHGWRLSRAHFRGGRPWDEGYFRFGSALEDVASTFTLPPEEIRRMRLEALVRELGPVGMVRFLQQLETGSGDYTAERETVLGTPTVAELAGRLERLRAGDAGSARADIPGD
jgi:hypothetical protein